MKNTEQAFLWIMEIIERLGIPYQISGGFAARIYGATRPLADIDIEVADEDIQKIYQEVKPYVIYGPQRYINENWDLELMTLNYEGQEIDIAGAGAKILNRKTGKFESLGSDFRHTNIINVFGKDVSVQTKEKLIEYKSKLLRDVDKEDIVSLTS